MKTLFRTATVAAVFAVTYGLSSAVLAQAKLEAADASMLKDIAQASIAEVETGKVAVEKTNSADIKKFAQMMVEDHTKGLSDVGSLAKNKGVELPDRPDAKHRAAMLKFKALQGDAFDRQYVKQAGVDDHEATEKLLKKTQAEAKDPEVKALATKMLPVVQGHLAHSQRLAGSVK